MATNYIVEKIAGTDSSSNRIASTCYGTCSTAAGTAQKDVTLSDSCVFNDNYLITGVTVHVKFTNSNTHATPTLKVGTATAKQIMRYGTTKPGVNTASSWQAGAIVSFTYDGTYWLMNDFQDAGQDTDTWRNIKVNGTEILGTATNTGALNLADGKGVALSNSSGTVTVDNSAGIYYVKGTQTAATASWTGNIAVPALYDGLTINYYLPYAGVSSTNVTLNLTLSDGTTTGAKNCYISTGRLTTHYGAGRIIQMTYFSAGSISISGTATTDDRWICDAYYDTNSDTKVRQTLLTNSTNRPLLMSYAENNSTTNNVDNVVYRNNSIYATPSTGTITALKFSGDLVGNADTATNASAVNGHTVGIDVPSNAVFTDQYVNQAANADANVAYQLLFEDTANSGNIVSGTRKTSHLTYNPSTSTLTLGNSTPAGGTVSVTNLSVTNINGYALPAIPKFSDQAVQQLEGGGNADYEIIFEDTASSGEITSGTRKSSNLTFNPSTGKLTVSGQVDCSGISVSTPAYTMTKSSGAWNVGSVTARKSGNIVQMQIFVKGTGTSVTSGGSGFVGKITGTYLPAIPTTFVSYISSVIVVCYIDASGNIDVRPYGNTYTASSGTTIEIDGMFICP